MSPRFGTLRARLRVVLFVAAVLVIVGGLFSRLLISVFLMPVLYVAVAREGDHLEV